MSVVTKLRRSFGNNVWTELYLLYESSKSTLQFLKVTMNGLDAVRQPMRCIHTNENIGVTMCNPKQIKALLLHIFTEMAV